MTNWLVGEGVLSEEMSNHIGLDLDWVPVLSTVDINGRSAHFWDDDAVSKMSFDGLWLLSWDDILLLDSELLDKSLVLSLNSMSESSFLS